MHAPAAVSAQGPFCVDSRASTHTHARTHIHTRAPCVLRAATLKLCGICAPQADAGGFIKLQALRLRTLALNRYKST